MPGTDWSLYLPVGVRVFNPVCPGIPNPPRSTDGPSLQQTLLTLSPSATRVSGVHAPLKGRSPNTVWWPWF